MRDTERPSNKRMKQTKREVLEEVLVRPGVVDPPRPSENGRDRLVTVVRRTDCSHAPLAVAAMRNLAEALGVPIRVVEVTVERDEDAEAHRCLGSPTVLINGQDIEPTARGRTSFGTT